MVNLLASAILPINFVLKVDVLFTIFERVSYHKALFHLSALNRMKMYFRKNVLYRGHLHSTHLIIGVWW